MATLSCQPAQDQNSLEPFAEFGSNMAIGLSVTSTNRVFVSFPGFNGGDTLALAEVVDGKLRPYPNAEWNHRGTGHFVRVQDLFVDAEDGLWVLDSQPLKEAGIPSPGRFKLVKINTRTDAVEEVYRFEELDSTLAALNDVRIDLEKQLAYLSDPGTASIRVLDLKSKRSWSALERTPYTLADNIALEYRGVPMLDAAGKPFTSHVNGIALTHDFAYLYFKPINKQHLYRIPTRYLADSTLQDQERLPHVEDQGNVGVTHGLIADKKGNIYLTTSEQYSISYLTPEGKLHTLVKDPQLLWPDSFGIGSDGYLYFTCAQLQRLPQWNRGEDRTVYPYRAFKVRLPDEAAP